MSQYFLYRITFTPQDGSSSYSNTDFGIVNNVMGLSTSGSIETYDGTTFYPRLIDDEGKYSVAADISQDTGFFDFYPGNFTVVNENNEVQEYLRERFSITNSKVEVFYVYDDGTPEVFNEYYGILIGLAEREGDIQSLEFECDSVTQKQNEVTERPAMIGDVRQAEYLWTDAEAVGRLIMFGNDSIEFPGGDRTTYITDDIPDNVNEVIIYIDRLYFIQEYSIELEIFVLKNKYLLIYDGKGKNFYTKIREVDTYQGSMSKCKLILEYPIDGEYQSLVTVDYTAIRAGTLEAQADKASKIYICDSVTKQTAIVSDFQVSDINLEQNLASSEVLWQVNSLETGIEPDDDFSLSGEEPANGWTTASGTAKINEIYDTDLPSGYRVQYSNGDDISQIINQDMDASFSSTDRAWLYTLDGPPQGSLEVKVASRLDFSFDNIRNYTNGDQVYLNIDLYENISFSDQSLRDASSTNYIVRACLFEDTETGNLASGDIPNYDISPREVLNYEFSTEGYYQYEYTGFGSTNYRSDGVIFTSEFKTIGKDRLVSGLLPIYGEHFKARYKNPIRFDVTSILENKKNDDPINIKVYIYVESNLTGITLSQWNGLSSKGRTLFVSSANLEVQRPDDFLLSGIGSSQGQPAQMIRHILEDYGQLASTDMNFSGASDYFYQLPTGITSKTSRNLRDGFNDLVKTARAVYYSNRNGLLRGANLFDEPASGDTLPQVSVRSDFVDELKLLDTPLEYVFNAFEIKIGEGSTYSIGSQDQATWSTDYMAQTDGSLDLTEYFGLFEEVWDIMSESWRTTRVKRTLSIDLTSVTDSRFISWAILNPTVDTKGLSTNDREFIARCLVGILSEIANQYGFQHTRADLKIKYDEFMRATASGDNVFDIMNWILIEDPTKTSQPQAYRIISIDAYRNSGTADIIALGISRKQVDWFIDEMALSLGFVDETAVSGGTFDETFVS